LLYFNRSEPDSRLKPSALETIRLWELALRKTLH